MKLIIKNATTVRPCQAGASPQEQQDCLRQETVYIQDGLFSQAFAEDPDTLVIDARGLHVLPGLIDAHAHLRDPGFEYKEDIESGTASAARGGFTTVACMPNTSPVCDNETVVRYIKDKAARVGTVNVWPIGAASKGQKGQQITEIGLMKEAGIVAVSDDGAPVSTADLMRKAMTYAADFNLTVLDHCEDKSLAHGGAMNEGYNSTVMGVQGIPTAAEDIMIARDIILAEYLELPVHICHVSTSSGVELIRQAKARGVKVTCETCPHYFTLTDDACLGFNTLARVNPPLRRPKDVAAIIEGLADGTIDIIATDHAPHHQDEKDLEFDQAANGMIGFETAWQLAYTKLVKTNQLSLADLARVMSQAPNQLFKQDRGSLTIGRPADITIIDLSRRVTVDRFKMRSRSKNSPYHGMSVDSDIAYTIVGGKVVYHG